MSDDEKDAQIGRAVQEYQEAKINLAHLNRKRGLVIETYELFGALLAKPSAFNVQYLRDRQLRHADGSNISHVAHLMNASDLIALLTEIEEAAKRLKSASDAMKGLGLANIE
jgi:hypothetical protein